MSIRYERNDYLAYALYNIPNSSNEDRSVTCPSHEREGVGSMASFGVFDGHMGAAAAEACSTQLHGMIALNSRQLSNVVIAKTAQAILPPAQDGQPPAGSNLAPHLAHLNYEDLRDAVVCEAINRSCNELDFEIRRFSNAGATVSSLFLLWDTTDPNAALQMNNGPAGKCSAPVRVYCANMGDSRCLMLRCYDTKEALSLPSNFEPALKRSHGQSSMTTLGSQMAGIDLGTAAASANRFVAAHMMSEDHKLSLIRERQRVSNGSTAAWKALPCDASPIFLPSYARTAPPAAFPGIMAMYGVGAPPPEAAGGNLSIVNNLPPIARSPTPLSVFNRSSSSHGGMFSSGDGLSNSAHGPMPGGGGGMGSKSLHGSSTRNSMFSALTRSSSNTLSRASDHGPGSSVHLADAADDNAGAQGFIFDWGYPPEEVMHAATSFMSIAAEGVPQAQCAPGAADPNYAKNIEAMAAAAAASMSGRSSSRNVGFSLSDSQHGKSQKPKQTVTDQLKDSTYEPPLVNRKSFIQARTSADGRTVGPEALFGRHNISIMMTRSMGDRYGPRSCVPMAEISACTVPPNTHVRFVLCSDGVWDVVSNEDVRCVGMIKSNQDPRMLASQLAQKAHRRRERAKMRMDDITVLVVDVNPNSFVGVTGKNGSDAALSGLTASLAGRMRGVVGPDGKEKCTIA